MSSLQTFVRTVGVRGITKATEERYLQLLLDSDDDHPVLLNHLTLLASVDMHLLEEIASCASLVAKDPEFVAGLLSAAFLHATNPKNRAFIGRLAAKAGLGGKLRRDATADLASLTTSQRNAFDNLREMADTFFHHVRSPRDPVSLRLTPLLIGCSGVGKSHLARLLARELNARLLELTVGSWVPHGAKQSPTTIETITSALGSDAPLVIFLDELDKYRVQDSTWSLGQIAEVFSLLDRSLVGGSDWTPLHSRRLRERTFIVGAGTWQDLWRNHIGKSIGFTSSALSIEDVRAKVRTANLIPEELLNRFNSDWQLLAPYTREDFEAIARQLNLPLGVLDPVLAAESGRNFRYVEDCVTRAAIAQRKRERVYRAQQQSPISDEIATEA